MQKKFKIENSSRLCHSVCAAYLPSHLIAVHILEIGVRVSRKGTPEYGTELVTEHAQAEECGS